MRRTVTVAAMTAAMLVPAAAASAAPGSNASCSNGKGGNSASYNYHGNLARATDTCVPKAKPPVDAVEVEPVDPGDISDS